MSLTVVNVSTSSNAASNTEQRCTTTSAAFTLTFPANPTNNDVIRVVDVVRNFGTNAVTVNVGSKNINGSSTMVLSLSGATYEFTYISASNEWIVFFDRLFSPNIVQSVSPGSNVTATISNNNLTVGLTGVLSPTISGLADGQFLVTEGTTWTNKSVISTDLAITDAPTTVTLGINKGNLTETGSSVLQITNGSNTTLRNTTVQVNQATASASGFLSTTDWNTFNNKLSALTTTTPAISVSGNAVNLANQNANLVLAGPSSGGAALPSFRSLVTNDVMPAVLSGSFTQGMIAIYDTANFLANSALTFISNTLTVAGTVATQALKIDETVTARTCGSATLGVNGRVTVLTTAVNSNSRIFLSYGQKTGAATAAINSENVVVNTSFRIQSTVSADRSVVYWFIINPA